MLDNGGKLKIAGFGLLRLSKLSADKAKLARPDDQLDLSSMFCDKKKKLPSGC